VVKPKPLPVWVKEEGRHFYRIPMKVRKPLIIEDGITIGDLLFWLSQFPNEGKIWIENRKGISNEASECWEIDGDSIIFSMREGAYESKDL
jgi:hypothetical protein